MYGRLVVQSSRIFGAITSKILNMRLTLDALQVIDAIDRHGSFAAAGEALFRVPSAVTYAVRKLEDDLGVALFDRSGRRAALTPAGQELLQRGRHLLAAAEDLEASTRRAATGWEAELRIAVDDIIPIDLLLPIIQRFYADNGQTRIRVLREVLGGPWDALADDRADLAVGAPGDVPSGQVLRTAPLGEVQFVFVVAPGHPLADIPEPVSIDSLREHRAIVVTDTSRRLSARSSGFLPEQPILALPSLADKLAAQLAGLGVGFLPQCLAAQHLQAGHLVRRQVAINRGDIPLHLAWRPEHHGNALQWFVGNIQHDEALQNYLAG